MAAKSIWVTFNEHDFQLNEEQQNFVEENWSKFSLTELARKIHNDETIGDRDARTKNIKLFIVKLKNNYRPDLTEEQKQFIHANAGKIGPLEIAKAVFKNNSLKPLNNEARLVDKYIKVFNLKDTAPESFQEKHIPPRALSRLIAKVNKSKPDIKLKEESLSGAHRKYLEQLDDYLNSPRFLATFGALRREDEKDLFEAAFIEGVYGKDLNSEDSNMYISLCSDYVLQKQIKAQLEMLNDELVSSVEDEDKNIKIALTEAFGKKSTEYNDCCKRIQNLQSALTTNRSKRADSQAALNSSLVGLVEAWKNEEQRKRMLLIAQAREAEVSKEIDHLESAPEYIAKILGVRRGEIARV